MTTPALTIEKPKLRRGLSYALKTSQLEEALREAQIEWPASLLYWTPRAGGSVLQAFYWLANANVPHDRVYIRAGSVASEHREDVVIQLRDRGMPVFVQWLRKLASLPRNAPVLNEEPGFEASYVDGRLQVWSLPSVDASPNTR